MKLRLPRELEERLAAASHDWAERDGTRRLLGRDATLWTGGDEDRWLGWLDAPAAARGQLGVWEEIAADARDFEDALLIGMGGSSLAPEVQRVALGRHPGQPRLHVLDSIHPDAIATVEREIDPARTLLVVASKSGSTLEPSLLLARLLATLGAATGGEAEAARRCLAITDPGSALEALARERGFRRVVLGDPTIGGRFSALSPFGLVPAAIQGVPVETWLARAEAKVTACHAANPARNPGVSLGLLLAAAAAAGRDKLTLVAHPGLGPVGAWLEQLIAESTGKAGLGVLPFEGEALSGPADYGADRLFVSLRLGGDLGPGDAARLDALAEAGHPVAELELVDPLDLAAEFYRWEFATAVAGAVLGVHPFDQPDVEAAKEEARRLTSELERTGSLPPVEPLAASADTWLFAPPPDAAALAEAAGADADVATLLAKHLARLGSGDYFALLAFVPPDGACLAAANRLRDEVRRRFRVATSAGFGPRYLHSTGQAHKGGPANGLYLIVTDTPREDLPIPGRRATFGQTIVAQARGDFAVLARRGRRVVGVHLGESATTGLPRLVEAIVAALPGAAT